MTKKTVACLIATVVLAFAHLAEAQPAKKIPLIGFIVTARPEEVVHLTKAFEDGLRELGYVEGRNVVLERRFANGQPERLPGLAAELARLKPAVIVSGSNPVIAALKQATTTIPVVMAVSRDPVGAGFVASLAQPGANITGLTNDPTPDIVGKNLELLKETVPRISRVGFLWNPVPPGAGIYKNAAEGAARKLGVSFQSVEVRGRDDFEAAFAAMVRQRVDGVLVLTDPMFVGPRNQVVRLAERSRLPVMYGLREFPEAGGLMSYGPNVEDQFRRAAIFVDKMLKGAKPADLPVEQPTKFEFVVNLKTAKAFGLTIPQRVLIRADQVIQ